MKAFEGRTVRYIESLSDPMEGEQVSVLHIERKPIDGGGTEIIPYFLLPCGYGTRRRNLQWNHIEPS